MNISIRKYRDFNSCKILISRKLDFVSVLICLYIPMAAAGYFQLGKTQFGLQLDTNQWL